jgi:hypothetical protein
VSCARPGFCTAVGSYSTKGHLVEALAATESHGRWGRAREVGLPPNTQRSFRYSQGAVANSVSCRGRGWCLAVGSYITTSGDQRAFSVTVRGGRIGRAVEVAPSAAGHHTNALTSVSCGASTCLAVGTRPSQRRMMAITYAHGRWRDASLISPPASAGTSPGFVLSQVSCVNGVCAAAGSYNDDNGDYDLVVSSRR